jgi:hypothetical protein
MTNKKLITLKDIEFMLFQLEGGIDEQLKRVKGAKEKLKELKEKQKIIDESKALEIIDRKTRVDKK